MVNLVISISIFFSMVTCTSLNERSEIWVISDVHIGSYWFTFENNTIGFYDFLGFLTSEETPCHTLIINGDFIDLVEYMHPVKILNSTNYFNYVEINVKKYIDRLKQIQQNGIKLIFVSGNHDLMMEKEFYEAVGLTDIEMYTSFDKGNLHIEHGHLEEMVCAPDVGDGVGSLIPIGYYAARALTYSFGLLGEKWRKLPSVVICELLSDIGMLDLIKDNHYFYKVLMSYSLGDKWGTPFLRKYEEFKNTDVGLGCFYPDCIGRSNVTVSMVAKKAQSMVQRFISRDGKKEVYERFLTQCSNYDYFVLKSDAELFILGHTHVPDFKIYQRQKNNRATVYANTGAWVDGVNYFSVVKVRAANDDGFNATFVELVKYEYESKQMTTMHSSAVPYVNSYDIMEAEQEEHIIRDVRRRRRRKREVGDELSARELEDFVTRLKMEAATEKDKEEVVVVVQKERERERARMNKNRNDIVVPSEWKCDPNFYGSGDGCDCGCGAFDPDCAPEKPTEECVHFCNDP